MICSIWSQEKKTVQRAFLKQAQIVSSTNTGEQDWRRNMFLLKFMVFEQQDEIIMMAISNLVQQTKNFQALVPIQPTGSNHTSSKLEGSQTSKNPPITMADQALQETHLLAQRSDASHNQVARFQNALAGSYRKEEKKDVAVTLVFC